MLNVFAAVGRVAQRTCKRSATGALMVKFTLAVARDKDKNGEIKVVHCRKDALQRIIYLRAASESAEQHLSAYRLYGGIVNSWRNET